MVDTVFIIGSGAVGMSLGKALKNAGKQLLGIHDIDAQNARRASELLDVEGFAGALPAVLTTADVVIVTVPDHRIRQVAELVIAEELYRKEQIWLHCSGHLNKDVFLSLQEKVRGIGTMHPAFVFPPNTYTDIPPNVFFAIGGDDTGEAVATAIVESLSGRVLQIPAEKRALYHAAMVMGSNYLVALLAAASDMLVDCEVDAEMAEEILFSLSESALSRSRALGLAHSLSGPVRRGDVSVVKDHLRQLAGNSMLQALYLSMGRATVELAAKQPGYCPDTAQTLRELLK